MITDNQIHNIIVKLIKSMKDEGLKVDSPYDISNFAEDYLCNHTYLIRAGNFYKDKDNN